MINPTKEKLTSEDYVGKAKPEKLPKPTYWPFILAFGLTLSLWGILTGWIIGISGILLFFIALASWIKEINHEEER
jgi:hypothetical protein